MNHHWTVFHRLLDGLHGLPDQLPGDLAEVPDEHKKYTVNVLHRASGDERTWPFLTQDAAQDFIKAVDRMSEAEVTEYNFVFQDT